MSEMDWIFLYGPPGSGKSTVGRSLAHSLHLPFIDLDARIESQAGCSIGEIFSRQGEDGFRQREREALLGVLAGKPGVVALGGGALLDKRNRAAVEAAGKVVCLNAPFEILLGRLQTQASARPLLQGDAVERLRVLLQERAVHYGSFTVQADTAQGTPEELAWHVQVAAGMYCVSGMGSGYAVRVQSGSLVHVGHMLHQRDLRGPLALVTDENVAQYHLAAAEAALKQAGYVVQPVIIPAGEMHKTMTTVQILWRAFLEMGLERGSTVVALGGGVVGDLAGFAAAVYQRGVPWVAVPTSLLAMVDASLGGKTGADLPEGKNLVGAFHSPSLVLADPLLLDTLPEVEQRNGMAEVLKHGIISDAQLFDLCRQGFAAVQARWDEIVRRAMAAKVKVIQEDPYERDRRAALNLGHTLGHALEIASDYRLRHGEAVGIGMLAAARLSEKLGMAEAPLSKSIAAALRGLGLPTSIPSGLDRQRILTAIRMDKKKAAGRARFVLPCRVGEVRWGIEVENLDAVVDSVLEDYHAACSSLART